MIMLKFIDDHGTFEIKNAGANSYLYFPVCNEAGIMGSVTPTLSGDLMTDQNHFILQPTSVEDLHNNKSSRNFWLKFEDGAMRSVTGVSVWQKAEGLEETTVRGGLLWHETERVLLCKNTRIRANVTNFAPAAPVTCEIMRVCLKNEGDGPVTFSPIAVIPLYGRSAANLRDHRHVTSLLHRTKTVKYGVTLTPTLSFDERGHLKNDTTYFVCGTDSSGQAPESFFPTVLSVTGEGGDFEMPFGIMNSDKGVEAGRSFDGVESVGGLSFKKCTLNPGEQAEYLVFIGAGDYEEAISSFGSSEFVSRALDENKAYWYSKARQSLDACGNAAEILAGQGLDPSDIKNCLLWVAAEPVLRRIYGCSFLPYHDYGKGGRGWRDLWQDCLALMIGDPSSVRDMLVNYFAGVRADGTNATIIGKKPGEFLADRNGIARVWMDHGVWTWITMKLYMELSGDMDVLLEKQVYFKDMLCMRARGRDEAAAGTKSASTILLDNKGEVYKGSLFEHMLLMHVTVACDVGDHGNMLLRGADWNDALDMAPEKGESVAFTAAYAGNMREMAEYLENRGGEVSLLKELWTLTQKLHSICIKTGSEIAETTSEKRRVLSEYCSTVAHCGSGEKVKVNARDLSEKLRDISDSIISYIRQNEMLRKDDLSWINGYYDNEGKAVESLEDGRIMLTGAVFAIMSSAAGKDDVARMIKTADRYLLSRESGGYRLNVRYHDEEYYARNMGRMFGFAYGSKENGAVFCHMDVMYAYALLERGFRDEAVKVIAGLLRQSMDFEKSRMYPGIPEYFDMNGRGMYPYLTGAASWLLLFLYRLGKDGRQ